MALTWREASTLKPGTKVVFNQGFDLRYPKEITIKPGTTATISENMLSDVKGFISLKPDNKELTEQLVETAGCIILLAITSWDSPSPISLTGNQGLLS